MLVDPGMSTPEIPEERPAVVRWGAMRRAAGPSVATRGQRRAIDDAEEDSNDPLVIVQNRAFQETV